MHAMMALASSGREQDVAHLLQAQAEAMAQPDGDNLGFLRDVGLDATQAVLSFVRGDHADAIERLRRVRPRAQRFGGSHAQRDLIDLTLIEAARRDGQHALAQALTNERRSATRARSGKPSESRA
jgi:hypothetical protein